MFIKSGRALDYWRLFVDGVKKKDDSVIWVTIQNQVKQDSSLYWDELSKEERKLGSALLAVKVKRERKKEVQQATYQLDDLIASINGNPSPEYRLKTAKPYHPKKRKRNYIVLKKNIKAYKLLFNVGKEAGQVIGHLHMHLLAKNNK